MLTIYGTVEGAIDIANVGTGSLLNRPLSGISGAIRGHAYFRAHHGVKDLGTDQYWDDINEARKMERTMGDYGLQGEIVETGSDFIWGLEMRKDQWKDSPMRNMRYKAAKAKRLYKNNREQYDKIYGDDPILGYDPRGKSFFDESGSIDQDVYTQFGHGLGGTLFSYELWNDGFETYGEPYTAWDKSYDNQGLRHWWKRKVKGVWGQDL